MDGASDMRRIARARTPEIKIHRETDPHAAIPLTPSPRSSPASSRGGTPERTSPKHVKGTRAKFIRQNPRFINSPICQMDPRSGGKSVAECLDWKEEGNTALRQAGHSSPTHDSTQRQDYRPPSPDTRPHPGQRFSPRKTSEIPLGPGERGREKISFVHQFDCRAEPDNEPEKGKLLGTFVWEPLPPSSPSSPAPPTSHQAPPTNHQTSHSRLFHS